VLSRRGEAKTEGAGSAEVPSEKQNRRLWRSGTYIQIRRKLLSNSKSSPPSQRGLQLYAFGTGSGANDLFFVFPSIRITAAFGHRDTVREKMIEGALWG